jgi:putative transposase
MCGARVDSLELVAEWIGPQLGHRRQSNRVLLARRRIWGLPKKGQDGLIRPGRPIENGLIESFKGRLRGEWLNVHFFWSVEDAHPKLEIWRNEYKSEHRNEPSHSTDAGLRRASYRS